MMMSTAHFTFTSCDAEWNWCLSWHRIFHFLFISQCCLLFWSMVTEGYLCIYIEPGQGLQSLRNSMMVILEEDIRFTRISSHGKAKLCFFSKAMAWKTMESPSSIQKLCWQNKGENGLLQSWLDSLTVDLATYHHQQCHRWPTLALSKMRGRGETQQENTIQHHLREN